MIVILDMDDVLSLRERGFHHAFLVILEADCSELLGDGAGDSTEMRVCVLQPESDCLSILQASAGGSVEWVEDRL